MKRWLAVAVAAAMLAVPVASAASFLEPGNGPQRTGTVGFEGPQTNATAFQVELPGVPAGQPALIGDEFHVVTVPNNGHYDGATENLTENALWRIDIDTAEVERILDLPERMSPIFGTRLMPNQLLVEDTETQEMVVLSVPEGEELWRMKPLPDDPRDFRTYRAMVTEGGTMYVAFWAGGKDAPDSPVGLSSASTPPATGVVALDPETGQDHWTRTFPDRPDMGGTTIAADEERLFLYTDRAVGDGTVVHSRQYEVMALSAEDGTLLWNQTDSAERQVAGGVVERFDDPPYGCCAYPLVTETAVSIRLDAFEAYNPATGEEVWTSEAGRSDHIEQQGALSMGIRGDVLIGTSPQTVYRLDAAEEGDIVWQDTSTDQSYGNEPTVLDETTAYVPIHVEDEDPFLGIGIEARDLETGEVEWRWAYPPKAGFDTHSSNQDSSAPAFGPGVVAWPAKDGTVIVVGETGASLGEPDVPEAKYPGVGNETTIDASGAEPGAFGNATRYMVDWGDGTVTGWQEDPAFSHAYNESGEYQAQVYAGNEANQTSSTFVTMNVGEEPPSEPNWVEERFEKGNQDMTFGVLGVAMALGGGAVGVARRRRKKSMLQEELETLEEGFEDTRDDPGECEAFLETRKARARSLMMDGALDEEQFGVLESRVEELGRTLRTSVLDERFQFLPYGLVQSLKKMLADGKISSWERDAVETLLEDEDALSEAQREKVRHQLDRWLVEDAGSGAR